MQPPESRVPLTADALGHLFAEIGALLRRRLGGPLSALFDTADDTLFELAEHTTDGTRQSAYFDGMRECRRKRSVVERTFMACVGERLHYPPSACRTTPRLQRLSLLGEEELEESLAVSAMVSKAEGQYARALGALNQRFGFMLSDPRPDDATNPVGPARLGECFRQAAEQLEVDAETRIVVYKLFERHVLGALEPIYSEINILLANAGVLPTLSATTVHRPTPSMPRRPAPVEEPPREHRAEERERHADAAAQLLQEVMGLLGGAPAATGMQRQGPAGLPDAPTPQDGIPISGMAMAASTLLGALSRLQRLAYVDPPATPDPSGLKRALLRESESLQPQGAVASGLAPEHERVIDLMASMFDYVRQDRNLPDPMQAQLSRLHLPFLKAALKDSELLSDLRHPAWELLEELDRAALSWSAPADPGERLLGRITDTVETLLGKFDGDPALFERLRDELRTFTQATRRRAELAEQRAVEAALGRERLQSARRQVRTALAARLGRQPTPGWLRHVLNRPWANYLVLQWLRQGENSPAYEEALAFVDDLLWAMRAGATDAERSRLLALLPGLEAKLRHGLSTVAYHESEIEALTGQLREVVRARLGEIPEPAFLATDESQAPAAAFDDDPDLDEEIEEDQPDPDSLDPSMLERIRALEPGTWFEFAAEQTGAERAKLSWISPISGRYLFVNRTGLRVADLTPAQLAQEMESGLARMLEGAGLLQRALGEIVEVLRRNATNKNKNKRGRGRGRDRKGRPSA